MPLVALLVLALDQATKAWITANMASHEIRPIIEGFLRLRYTENTGAAFGLFRDWTGALSIAAIIIIVVLVLSASRVSSNPVLFLALGFVLGGALGNLVDRLRLGYVVDFVEAYGLRLNIGGTIYTFPVFNVADSAITVGVILIIATMLFAKQEDKPTPIVETHGSLPVRPVSRTESPWSGQDD
jgi:signal peptidase II